MKRLSIALLLLLVTLSLLSSCSDDEMLPAAGFQPVQPDGNAGSRAAFYTSSLVQDENRHWKANRRVPLVGKGRIVDDVASNLVSVLDAPNALDRIVDEDLSNCAFFAGAVGAQVIAEQIVSVRDVHHTYAAGQKVGFMFKVANFNTLGLNVLKSFWIQTFLNGEKQESFGNKQGTQVLELDLISVANNDEVKELSFTATKPFDEVQFNIAGVSADVLNKGLSIYYAFVGENEEKTGTRGSTYFPDAHLHDKFLWTNILNSDHIVDNDLSNYAYYGTLSGLLGDPRATVDFGKDIPAGSEVGFVISQVDILNLSALCNIKLETYDADDNLVDKATFGSVLDLSLVKVGNKTRVSMITTAPCRQLYIAFLGLEVKLGGTDVFYAYARDAVTVDVSSQFSACDVKITGNSYTLPMGKKGTTEWQLISSVPGTMPEIKTFKSEEGPMVTKIIGMTQNGKYTLRGVYTPTTDDGKPGTPVIVEFVITREALTIGEECNNLLGESAGASIGDIVGGGSLISIGDFLNPENLVDDKADNYATYVGGLKIAGNVGICAIDLKEPVNTECNDIRVGFTIQNNFDFLGLNLLDFFQIRLYLNGNETAVGIVNKSEVGNVSLIGSKGNKIRMSIKTKAAFDKIELWTVGVLELKLKNLRFYNAFWESADEKVCPAGDAGEACMEMLTYAQGAEVIYNVTKPDGFITVGGTFDNLGNLLDEDPKSFAKCWATNVAGTFNIGIKFPPLPRGSTIGFIVEAPNGLADVQLLHGCKLEVWSHGTRVVRNLELNFLKVDLLGHKAGRAYVEARVDEVYEFDEVYISFPSLINILEYLKIYGAFTRRDTNGDGIPDCSEDIENPIDPVKPIVAAIVQKHVCLHDDLDVQVTEGGEVGQNYTVKCWNAFRNNELISFTQKLTQEKIFHLPNLTVGEYFIRIEKEGKEVYPGALEAYVHPLLTTWKKDAQNTDWNRWENWTEGAPWTCTDVILPTGCVRYPVLQDMSQNTQGLKNYCANLHIESHAELVNTHLLDQYDYAWMELTLESGKNYILSSPLTNTVTGDYFIPAKWAGNHAQEHKFVRLTSTNSPENRFAPRIYQRCWSCDVPGKVLTDGLLGTTVITSETDWTAPFNAVAEPIREGMGWMVRAEKEGLNTNNLTFRFPKTHGDYSYFAANGSSTGTSESVARNSATMGHFVVDREKKLPYTVTVSNRKAGPTFVVGNPFAAHLNIARFLEANKGVIREVKLTNGNGTHTVLYQPGKVTATVPGFTHIAPMQGFYVTAIQPAQQLTLTFTEGMQEQMPGYNIYANGEAEPEQPATRAAAGEDVLRITAKSGGKSTQCVVKLRPDSERGFRPGEDSRLLYDGENPPTVAVFTVAEGIAADIQQLPSAGTQSVSLGWRMEHPRDLTLQFSHPARSEWKGWMLENRETGRRVALDKPETFVNLDHQSTRIGGWCLVKKTM